MSLIPRILPVTQRPVVDIPDTTEGLVQVLGLFRCRIKAVTIGAIGHLQIVYPFMMLIKQQLNQKTAVLADGPHSLPGINAGVSRGKS